MAHTINWINLYDTAKLKLALMPSEDGGKRTFLFITGLSPDNPRWEQAQRRLNFISSGKSNFLARALRDDERVTAQMFHPVWPRAAVQPIDAEEVVLNLQPRPRNRQQERDDRRAAAREELSIQIESGEVRRLGRNADGNEVFHSALGRFVMLPNGHRMNETDSRIAQPGHFLRVAEDQDLSVCADGFIQSILAGDVQHKEDLDNFLFALTNSDARPDEAYIQEVMAAIDAASVRQLHKSFDTAQEAYGTSNLLYQYMPEREAGTLGAGAMPLPLSVMAQRLLGDTKDKEVYIPNAWDGASFAFVAPDSRIHAYTGSDERQLSRFLREMRHEEVSWSGDFFAQPIQPRADAVFFNADPAFTQEGGRQDYAQANIALQNLRVNGRAVLVLAGDEGLANGAVAAESAEFLRALAMRYDVQDVVEINPVLMRKLGNTTPLRLVSVKNTAPHAQSWRANSLQDGKALQVMNSWDELKSHVDEEMLRLNILDALPQQADLESVKQDNDFQRPYTAFSRIGEARTMVPMNLQAPLNEALSRLEQEKGAVDAYVGQNLGYQPETMADRLSPEQVDALALTFNAWEKDRAIIVGDDTGLGKGRVCAGAMTHALLKLNALKEANDPRVADGAGVIFITDRAGLFSDMMRDMRDIEEFGRFRPMLMNADAKLVDIFTGEEVATGTKADTMKALTEGNATWNDLGTVNMIMMTYSQVSGADSPKAEWVRNLATSSAVIADEAHIAAGGSSNISNVVTDVMNNALFATYLSATWSKSSNNLGIYRRAFPPSINVSTLQQTMKVGGEPFSEIFTSMLARDGAFIRREHDLSKLKFEVSIDNVNRQRNEALSDRVAQVLAAMTYFSGDVGRLMTRLNRETVEKIKEGRSARMNSNGAISGRMFSSNFGAGTVLYTSMRRLLTMLNVDNTFAEAHKALEQNQKPIVVFDETAESFIKAEVLRNTFVDPQGKNIKPQAIVVPTLRDMLRNVALRQMKLRERAVQEEDVAIAQPTNTEEMTQEQLDSMDDARIGGIDAEELVNELQRHPDAQDEVVLTQEFLEQRGIPAERAQAMIEAHQEILRMIEALPPIPLNIIDIMQMRLEQEGYNTGEISGRSYRLRPVNEALWNAPIDSPEWANAQWRLEPRQKADEKTQARDGFNNGEIDVVFINRAGSAGISLHASPRFADTRQRVSIDLQIPEDPTTRMQLYGRSNRFDQIVAPRMVTSTPGIYGETRQLMMQNKKLARLSASTRSSSENPADLEHIPDLLNVVGGRIAREYLEDNGGFARRLAITGADMEAPDITLINRITSRAVMLTTKEQKLLFEELESRYNEEIQRLEESNSNPLRTKELDVRARETSSALFIGVEGLRMKSAFDEPVYLKTVEWEENFNAKPINEIYLECYAATQNLVEQGKATVQPQTLHEAALYEGLHRYHDRTVGTLSLYEDLRDGQLATYLTQDPESLVTQANEQAVARLAQLDDEEVLSSPKFSALPTLSMTPMVERLNKIMSARIVIELGADDRFDSVDEAVEYYNESPSSNNTTAKLELQRQWIVSNLEHMVPGMTLQVDKQHNYGDKTSRREQFEEGLNGIASVYEMGVIVNVHYPERTQEAQLSRYKFDVWMPKEAKTRTLSLQQVLRDVFVIDGQVIGAARPRGSLFPSNNLMPPTGYANMLASSMRNAKPRVITRKAVFLTGNLYLASEWAMANKAGHGVIYTDEQGVRQRAVQLTSSALEIEGMRMRMPCRLWTQEMSHNILKRCFQSETAEELTQSPEYASTPPPESWTMYTNYEDALLGHNKGKTPKGAVIHVVPQRGLFIELPDARRSQIAGQLRNSRQRILQNMIPDFQRTWKSYTPDQRKTINEHVFGIKSSRANKGVKGGVIIGVVEINHHHLYRIPKGADGQPISATQRDATTLTPENFYLTQDERLQMVVDTLQSTIGLDLYIAKTQMVCNEHALYKEAQKEQTQYFWDRGAQEVTDVDLRVVDEINAQHDLEFERYERPRG